MNDATKRLRAVLYDLTNTLLVLFDVHGADPDLIEQTADKLQTLAHEHLGRSTTSAPASCELALERLLDDLDADELDEATDD